MGSIEFQIREDELVLQMLIGVQIFFFKSIQKILSTATKAFFIWNVFLFFL